MNAIYNYLIADYSSKANAESSVHKRSELKTHYSNIVNFNKRSPIYLIELTNEKEAYAINMKDKAMELHSLMETIADNGEASLFLEKKVISQDDSVSPQIMDHNYKDLPEPFNIKVNRLARPQRNQGAQFYAMSKCRLEPGEYDFTINIDNKEHLLRYNIPSNASNLEVATQLTELINQTDIGLSASVEMDEQGEKINMILQSRKSGDKGRLLFRMEDIIEDQEKQGIISYYGLNRVEQKSTSAEFEIDGKEMVTNGNTFVLNESLQLILTNTMEEEKKIEYKIDAQGAMEHMQKIIDSYNGIILCTSEYATDSGATPKLSRELEKIIHDNYSEMEACGIYYEEEGTLAIDKSLMEQAIQEGDLQELFSDSSHLATQLRKKTSMVSINPMEYVDKIIVSYPNLGKSTLGYSYITSMYSGMLFNYYC